MQSIDCPRKEMYLILDWSSLTKRPLMAATFARDGEAMRSSLYCLFSLFSVMGEYVHVVCYGKRDHGEYRNEGLRCLSEAPSCVALGLRHGRHGRQHLLYPAVALDNRRRFRNLGFDGRRRCFIESTRKCDGHAALRPSGRYQREAKPDRSIGNRRLSMSRVYGDRAWILVAGAGELRSGADRLDRACNHPLCRTSGTP